MTESTAMVAEFHKATNAPILDRPRIPNEDRVQLRLDLLREEIDELELACKNKDVAEVADALTDIKYILCGTYLEFGMQNIERECFKEVHQSNMSKFCIFTHEARDSVNRYLSKGVEAFYKKVGNLFVIFRSSDNKVLKAKDFKKPDLVSIVRKERRRIRELNKA